MHPGIISGELRVKRELPREERVRNQCNKDECQVLDGAFCQAPFDREKKWQKRAVNICKRYAASFKTQGLKQMMKAHFLFYLSNLFITALFVCA